MTQLSRLRSLEICFLGSLPEALLMASHCTQLEALKLSWWDGMERSLQCEQLSRLQSLTLLELSNANLDASPGCMGQLGALTALRQLSLFNCNLWVGHLPTLSAQLEQATFYGCTWLGGPFDRAALGPDAIVKVTKCSVEDV